MFRNSTLQLPSFPAILAHLTLAVRLTSSKGHIFRARAIRDEPSAVQRPSLHKLNWKLAGVIAIGLSVAPPQLAWSQTFSVLHSFTGGGDGASPGAGLTVDPHGNFYGTTEQGGPNGPNGYGTAFKLTHHQGGWVFTPLYAFGGGQDGSGPAARVIIGPDGSLYGTTHSGGGTGCGGNGCGTVFNLKPPPSTSASILGGWVETVLYRFTGGSDGAAPVGDLVFDQSGNIYGTAASGGSAQKGVVYELTPSNGNWADTVLWTFTGGSDGGEPTGGVIFDGAGNLYGAAQLGGASGYGAVFRLVPSGGGWSQTTLYSFQNGSDGANPNGGLIFDSSGDLYGSTSSSGSHGGGTIFELKPQQNGTWALSVLDALTGQTGGGPQASLARNAAGTVYGTAYKDGADGYGSVLSLITSNGSWVYTDLHDFTFGNDGAEPVGNVVLDANGNLYGTAIAGGTYGYGVVFEITPLQITTSSLPAGTINVPYSAALSVTGGVSPYTWSVIQGRLPTGLTLNASSGAISGTPTAGGTFNFPVQVSDSESPPATAVAPLSITVQSALVITTSSLPSGTVNNPYSATLSAAGGTPPYTWSITQGSLPGGLSLNAGSGVISGTPTMAGNFNFTVQVRDSESPPATANAPLGITVSTASIFLSWSPSNSPGVIGYNVYRGTVSGGPYTKINSSLISSTNYNDQAVQSGQTYYYVTTAVNNQGMESGYSNQASAIAP